MPKYNPNSVWESKEDKSSPKIKYFPSAPKRPSGETQSMPVHSGPSFFGRHKLLFFSIGLLLSLALIGLVFYLLLPPPSPNVILSFSKPDQATIGVPFILSVSASNDSNTVLENASLEIQLPAGISFVGQPSTQRVLEQAIGDIGAGGLSNQSFNLITTGNPSTEQSITATLVYNTEVTGNNQLETNSMVGVLVGSPAISLTYNTPSSIFSGQNFNMTINYQNNTSETLNNVQLQTQYPPAYTFQSGSMIPGVPAGNVWNLGTLGPQATGTISITGNIVGPNGAQYQLNGVLSAAFSGQTYSVNSQAANFTIASAPLSVAIAVNNSSSYVSSAGDSLNYVLTYSNNSNVTFSNMTVTAALTGLPVSMFNLSSLQTSGSFNSKTDTITWYAANTPQLLSLAPGQSGSVDFSINTKASFPIEYLSDKDYTLNVLAQIQSPTVLPNTEGSSTVSASTLQTDVGDEIALTSEGYWHDPQSGILNSGPYPPKVNQATQYTIHWSITNYSADAQNVTVSAYLQSGTTFTGMATSTVSSTPIYNAATGLITWTIPLVPATTGVIGPPMQAIFQVSNTPAVNQVGQDVTLLGPTTLTGTDAFTGNALQLTTNPVTTALPDDTSINDQSVRTVSQ